MSFPYLGVLPQASHCCILNMLLMTLDVDMAEFSVDIYKLAQSANKGVV